MSAEKNLMLKGIKWPLDVTGSDLCFLANILNVLR